MKKPTASQLLSRRSSCIQTATLLVATAKLWVLSLSAQTLLPDLTPLHRVPELVGWSNAITLGVVILSVFFWARGEILGKRNPATSDDPVAKAPVLEAYFNFAAQLRTITDTLASMKTAQDVSKLEYKDLLYAALSAQRHALIEKLSDVQAELLLKAGDGQSDQHTLLEQIGSLRDFMVRMEERDRQVLTELNNRDRASTERDRALELALHELINIVTRRK